MKRCPGTGGEWRSQSGGRRLESGLQPCSGLTRTLSDLLTAVLLSFHLLNTTHHPDSLFLLLVLRSERSVAFRRPGAVHTGILTAPTMCLEEEAEEGRERRGGEARGGGQDGGGGRTSGLPGTSHCPAWSVNKVLTADSGCFSTSLLLSLKASGPSCCHSSPLASQSDAFPALLSRASAKGSSLWGQPSIEPWASSRSL